MKYTRCNHRVFDADYAGVENRCPECRKVFEVKLEERQDKVNKFGTEPHGLSCKPCQV